MTAAKFRSDSMVLRRPHFQLRENALFFLASERPAWLLSEAEAGFWNLVADPVSVGFVRQSLGDAGDALLAEFLQRKMCDLVEPASSVDRRRVLVIEPHADDAALSAGGVMWLRRLECSFVIATMASRSNHTSHYNEALDRFDIDAVTELRRRESELFARMIGGDHVPVGLTDAPLRYRDSNWTREFFRRHRMSITLRTSRLGDEEELRRWADAVRQLLTQFPSAEVWIPMGGPHADHMLTVDACLEVLVSEPALLADRILRVYEDIPYAARDHRHMDNALKALQRAGLAMEQELIQITAAMDEKRRLASVYASQNIDKMCEDMEARARALGSPGYAESLWTVKRLPRRLERPGVVSSATGDRDRDVITAWVSRNKDKACLRIFLLIPTGRWAADLRALSSAFPKARFELYVSATAAAEVEDTPSDRVAVRHTPAGLWAWIRLSLRLSVGIKSVPLLFLAGEKRLYRVRLLSRLWLRSDALIVGSMDWVLSALRGRC